MKNKQICIVGGGLSGLALSYFLSSCYGMSSQLFERNSELGGRISAVRKNTGFDIAIDNSPHLMLSGFKTSLQLLEELGQGRFFEYVNNGIVFIDSEGEHKFFRAHKDRFWFLFDRNFRFNRYDWYSLLRLLSCRDERISLDECLHRKANIDRFWSPLCLGFFNNDISLVGARIFTRTMKYLLEQGGSSLQPVISKVNLESLFIKPLLGYLHSCNINVHKSYRVRKLFKDKINVLCTDPNTVVSILKESGYDIQVERIIYNKIACINYGLSAVMMNNFSEKLYYLYGSGDSLGDICLFINKEQGYISAVISDVKQDISEKDVFSQICDYFKIKFITVDNDFKLIYKNATISYSQNNLENLSIIRKKVLEFDNLFVSSDWMEFDSLPNSIETSLFCAKRTSKKIHDYLQGQS